MIQPSGVDKSGGLIATDLLVKDAVKEGILYIKLMHRLAARPREGEHRPNCSRLDHR